MPAAERPARSRARVDVEFTDRDGVRWRIYEFGISAGRKIRYPIGTVEGLYRGFERRDGARELRALLIARKDEIARARILSVAELQRELDASKIWPRHVAREAI